MWNGNQITLRSWNRRTANMHSINHETWASSSGKTDKEHLFTAPIRYYCRFHSRVQVLFWKLKSCVKSIFVEILSHLNGHKRASLIFNLKGGFESSQNSPNVCTRQLLSVRYTYIDFAIKKIGTWFSFCFNLPFSKKKILPSFLETLAATSKKKRMLRRQHRHRFRVTSQWRHTLNAHFWCLRVCCNICRMMVAGWCRIFQFRAFSLFVRMAGSYWSSSKWL